MFEITHSRKRHICTLCNVSTHRLVIWDPAHLLRLEDADEPSNEAIRYLDSVSGIFVSAPDLSFMEMLTFLYSASTATIVRIVYIKSLTETDDYSWEGINLVKWSMVEPAIAITAMNIATLRPLFKNFFHFASKKFDGSTDEEDGRVSGDSQKPFRGHANSVNANDYSVEFAQLLGLSRVGVTTMITAGESDAERNQMKKRFSMRRGSSSREKSDNESQTELNPVPSLSDNIDWSGGIKATTVVTQSRQ